MFEHAGPKEIKLFFNAKRPQMPDHPRTRSVKVYKVEKHGGDVIPTKVAPIECEREEHVNAGRWQYSVGTPDIKLTKIDGGCLTVFVEQEASDQVAGDDEKNLHPRKRVVGHEQRNHLHVREVPKTDQRDGYRAQTVERRDPFHCSSLAFSAVGGVGYLKASIQRVGKVDPVRGL